MEVIRTVNSLVVYQIVLKCLLHIWMLQWVKLNVLNSKNRKKQGGKWGTKNTQNSWWKKSWWIDFNWKNVKDQLSLFLFMTSFKQGYNITMEFTALNLGQLYFYSSKEWRITTVSGIDQGQIRSSRVLTRSHW